MHAVIPALPGTPNALANAVGSIGAQTRMTRRGDRISPFPRSASHVTAETAPAAELLRSAARAVLDRLPQLTERVLTEIRATEPRYLDGAVSEAEVRENISESLRIGLLAVPDPRSVIVAATQCSWNIGRRRARCGMPLEALLNGYRIGATMLWDALVAEVDVEAIKEEPYGMEVLLRACADGWAFHAEQWTILSEAYRSGVNELAARHDEQARAALDALLDEYMPPDKLPYAATALDLPERGRYVVVVVRGNAAPRPPRPVPGQAVPPAHGSGRDLLRAPAGMRAVRRSRNGSDIIVVLLGDGSPDDVAAAVNPPAGARAGMSQVVHGLGELNRARQMAELALRTCVEPGELARLDERLPAALVAAEPDLGGSLLRRVLGPVLDLDPDDRDLLVSTLTTWLDAGGSAARAGGRLFCHRNTVLNRLRRLEQLTGRTLSDPRDLVELTLALDAFRLHRGES